MPQQDYKGCSDISQEEEYEAHQNLLAQMGFHKNDGKIYPLSYDLRAKWKVRMDNLDDERK